MNLRKIVSFVLASVLVVSMSSVTAIASEGKTDSASSTTMEVLAGDRSSLSPRVERTRSELKDLPTEIGQTEVVKSDENGTMYVTLISEKESTDSTRSNREFSEKSYLFRYVDNWGLIKEAFQVDLECTWYRNGINSSIYDLRGTCYPISDVHHLRWVSKDITSVTAELELSATYLDMLTYYLFSATVVNDPGNEKIYFRYSTY